MTEASITQDPVAVARGTHRGVFITGQDRLELLDDSLPESAFESDQILIESLGNCRCSSDKKAIHQFQKHARIPNDATQVALGHECVQRVLQAPPESDVRAGDIVLVTPGHFATPHDPDTFEPDANRGVLASLGYSYRFLGGLRQFSAVPRRVIDVVASQGFGKLFNPVPKRPDVSLASLAHAEPFACCYGTMKNMFYVDRSGKKPAFRYGIPPRARIAFLGGTARMAMIKLTILAARSDDELPERVAITGSQKKLDALSDYALIRGLRERGVEILLADRRTEDLVETLTVADKYDAVFTNFPSQEVFDQAVAIIETGGNLNNYAGAVDPDIYLSMCIPGVPPHKDFDAEAKAQIAACHHNVAPNDPERYWGIAKEGSVLLLGFDGQKERLEAYRRALTEDCEVTIGIDGDPDPNVKFTDVFIAGSGPTAANAYARIEYSLARSAAVNFVDGVTTIKIRSKHVHYASRHQICGRTVPYSMTNTSEPVSEDMAIQGNDPIDFDWMVKGVAGLNHAVEMIQDVTEREPFGSFFALTQLPELPYVAVSSRAFQKKARKLAKNGGTPDERVVRALETGARVLAKNGDVWSRQVEEALYEAFGRKHPLA